MYPVFPFPPTLGPRQSPVCFLSLIGSSFLNILNIKRNYMIHSLLWLAALTQHNVFQVPHFVACTSTSFLFIASNNSFLWIFHILFIQSLVNGHLGSFHFLASINATAVLGCNLCVHVPFISLGSMPRSGIAGVYSFLRRLFSFFFFFGCFNTFGVDGGKVMTYPLSIVDMVSFVDGWLWKEVVTFVLRWFGL